ncbi:Lrp/AsnC family transcriptional regulator [Candidatus Saganbacteria bacterium]|nr:Lrp/AsnC family transcriptional regulator [Candidatus Saganbacteria bacterium]
MIDQIDKNILNELQFNFPIVEKPFKEIADRIGISEDEVLTRVSDLKKDYIIRRIGPTFEGSKLGYVNALVAAKAPEDKLDEIGQYVAGFEEVTHDYSRDHEFNLWFTLTCKSVERMDEIIAQIEKKYGDICVFLLPATKKFKINARFEL